MRRKIVAGNWKLHGDRKFAYALMDEIAAGLPLGNVRILILPPLPYLGELTEDYAPQGILLGAQDVSSNEKGAYTGEVSASMLADVGATHGLVGHLSGANTTRKATNWWHASSWPRTTPS